VSIAQITNSVRRQQFLIIIVGALFFVPFLGSVRLFDWDEINFAECAREMIVTGDYLHMQIDYRPFTEKPPLFVWMQVLSMHVFGINEFAARLPNAIVGIITLLVLHHIGRRVGGDDFGLLWPMVYLGTLLPHFYARSGIIDPMFNLFIFLAIWQIIRGQLEGTGRPLQSGLYASLAVMTKGPVGLGLVVLTLLVMWAWQRRSAAVNFPAKDLLIVTVTALTLPAIWLGIDAVQNGPTFLIENINYQWRLLTTGEAGHAQPWYYHSIVLLIGCYPASLFFFRGLASSHDEDNMHQMMRRWMTVLFFVVLVVFSAVTTKIVHYSSMTYIPMTYLAATQIQAMIWGTRVWGRGLKIAVLFIGLVLTSVAVIVPWAFMNSEWMLSLSSFRDAFLRQAMSRKVEWLGVEPLVGLILLIGILGALIVSRRSMRTAMIVLFGSVAVFIAAFLPLVAPRIEAYSQGAALDYYASLRGKGVYTKPLTMKSYAHLFYTQKPYHLSSAAKGIAVDDWEPWLISGDIDRPATFVCRVNDAANWSGVATLREKYRDGGFIIYGRVTSSVRPLFRNP
jgi:hypothetical protein